MNGGIRERIQLARQERRLERLKQELLRLEIKKVKAQIEDNALIVKQIENLEQRKMSRIKRMMEKGTHPKNHNKKD